MNEITNTAATKRWGGLFKEQPNSRIQLNKLRCMNDSFTDSNPKLNVAALSLSGDSTMDHPYITPKTTPTQKIRD